jgi:CheY-like chemotaxis protein
VWCNAAGEMGARALLYVSMPPTDTPAIAASPARLLAGVILLALVVALALLLAWRRARVAAVNEPLARLRGFHIFGPDDGEEAVIHVPVLTARPVVRTRAVAPQADTAPPLRGAASLTGTAAVASRSVQNQLQPIPAVLWNTPATTVAAAAVAAVVDAPESRRCATGPAARAEGSGERGPEQAETDVTLEGTAAPPAVPRSRPRRPEPDPSRPGDVPLGRDILLVEDDATIADMYAMLLATKGYVTRHARDGLEGIAMVREELPSLVLLDMMMPRMDGLQFLRALRDWPRTSDLPVVILSNVSDRHLVEKAMRLGAIEYLVKAHTRPQVLLGALPHWLRGNRALTTLS